LTLYTHQKDMGKKNKVVKLTARKIRYFILAKKRGDSTKRIAEDMKLSPSSVKRVWMHWTKTKMHVNRNKSKRRKPWIRFERKHSLSMVHLDWHTSIHDGKKVFVCVVLDDSSRRILAGGEFDAETTENSLWLLREAMDKFGCLASIEQVLTDRGIQFYANIS
jgi:transposase